MAFSFSLVRTTDAALDSYADLFRICFPAANHYSRRYLRWLYSENPAGHVVGFDATDGDALAAHYACVPARLSISGVESLGLLSLNTATHPRYQGKGLFTKLAAMTYAFARDRGFTCVYGVANARSTPGFVRKLKFTLATPLRAQLSVGSPYALGGLRDEDRQGGFRRLWPSQDLAWRAGNPSNPVQLTRLRDGRLGASARTGHFGIRVWAEIPGQDLVDNVCATSAPFGVKLFLGLIPREEARSRSVVFNIPSSLRPSPLNLIYRRLGDIPPIVANAATMSFLDFDAY